MGPHGEAAGGVDGRDRLLHRRRRSPAIRGPARQQIGLEKPRRVLNVLAGEPIGIAGVLDHGAGEMRATDRCARARTVSVQLREIDVEAEFLVQAGKAAHRADGS